MSAKDIADVLNPALKNCAVNGSLLSLSLNGNFGWILFLPRVVFLWNKKCSGFSMAIAVYLKVRLSKIIAIVIYEEGNV